MQLGRLRLHLLSDGPFGLDGGAMFGVVPRALWARLKPPDALNRIAMTSWSALVERGDDLVLIDTGIGPQDDPVFRQRHAMDDAVPRLPERIASAGYDLGDVTHVVLTHLHFDHAGWNTVEKGGRRVPTFPHARYWLQRGEVEHARSPNERDRASYLSQNWEPLFEAGAVELFGDEAEPVTGVRALRTPGHTADFCIVELEGGRGPGEVALFLGDLVPTSAHLSLPWIMSYDLFPMATLENKKRWLPRAAEGGWPCIFQHDPETPLATIREERPGRWVAEPLDADTSGGGAP